MISFEEAYKIVMDSARPLGTEEVPIAEALHRVLAQEVQSDMDMPPFDKSAMDGFACRRDDLAEELTVVESIKAGDEPAMRIEKGQCARIMTGAIVPQGADCVVMVEETDSPTPGTTRFTGSNTRNNICYQGEDIQTGALVLSKGTLIEPQHIAMLASVGCVNPTVTRQARVGVIATGDELVEPHAKPSPAQIRTSNSYQLCAQILKADAIPTYYGIAIDTEEAIGGAIGKAAAENDVILLSGGVSMGDFDLVPGAMKDNGIEILFDAIEIRPGKPTTFGHSPQVYCFGLPGNPVPTYTQFEILVKPFLHRLMGHDFAPPRLMLPLAEDLTRKKTDRDSLVLISITQDGHIQPCAFHGSAHVSALCAADGAIIIPKGVKGIEKETPVDVRLF